MKTALGVDALENPIHEGDLLLDGSGRAYFAVDTENSFIRQGLINVHLASLRRGFLWQNPEVHSHILTKFSVVYEGTVPVTQKERRSLYEELVKQRMGSWKT